MDQVFYVLKHNAIIYMNTLSGYVFEFLIDK